MFGILKTWAWGVTSDYSLAKHNFRVHMSMIQTSPLAGISTSRTIVEIKNRKGMGDRAASMTEEVTRVLWGYKRIAGAYFEAKTRKLKTAYRIIL